MNRSGNEDDVDEYNEELDGHSEAYETNIVPPDADEPQLTTRIRAGGGDNFPPADARIKEQLMDAQESVFGINNYASKQIINEQNYTSRAAGAKFRPSLIPNPKQMAYNIPAELNKLTPISI